ncbi:MAG: hypothetical protein K0U20_08875, partial [Proteobacteria bacterium]|nr:hypothetical protein [Pseudomonadota bacterium]
KKTCYACYMVKELITKAELARRAMVTPTAVTKACKGILFDATEGKRIDANHASVRKYIADHTGGTTNEPATGIDELYEDAVRVCRENQRYTVSNISRKLKIGNARAKKIFAMMQAAGTDKPGPAPPPGATTTTATPVVSGQGKKNHTKKTAALENINNGTVIHEIPEDIKNFADMTLRELIQRFGTDIAFLDWLKAVKAIEDINEKRLKNAQTRKDLVSIRLVKTGVIEHFETAFNKLLTDGAKTIARRVTSMNGAGRSVEDCEAFVADQVSSFIKPAKAKIARALRNA